MSAILFASVCNGIKDSTKSNSKSLHKGNRILRFVAAIILMPKRAKLWRPFCSKNKTLFGHCLQGAGVNFKNFKTISRFWRNTFSSDAELFVSAVGQELNTFAPLKKAPSRKTRAFVDAEIVRIYSCNYKPL